MNKDPKPAVTKIDLPDLPLYKSGKVREVFDLGDSLLLVASDRISAFDCVLPDGIPAKGAVLNLLSAWWFERTRSLVDNHYLSSDVKDFPGNLKPHRELLQGRAMRVRKTQALPVECVVRGYLVGSGWKEYQESGSVCGISLRPGYQLADRLDKPIYTPARKAETGHDENISFERSAEIVGLETAERLRDLSLALYQHAADYARQRGIIIADTKFEFGLVDDKILLIDEALTPDSSRFWPADSYAAGSSPPSYDKQYVRDYLETLDWDKTPPAPSLPPEVILKTSEKYRQVYRELTGADLP